VTFRIRPGHLALVALSLAALPFIPSLLATPGTNSQATTIPDHVVQLASRAERSFVGGNLKEAESCYGEALKSLGETPPPATLLISFAAVKTRLGKISESRALLRKALSIDLNGGSAWMLLGMNALEQKDYEEAVADLVQATLHDGKNPRAHNYLGMATGKKGWKDASEQELRRAVELDPNYADANFNLAVLYLSRTPPLYELAHRHYQRALDLGAAPDPAIEKLIAKSVATPASTSSTSSSSSTSETSTQLP